MAEKSQEIPQATNGAGDEQHQANLQFAAAVLTTALLRGLSWRGTPVTKRMVHDARTELLGFARTWDHLAQDGLECGCTTTDGSGYESCTKDRTALDTIASALDAYVPPLIQH